ncbi:MAG TPA: sulfatase [Vicinamibacteria bacterium]|nr:sulfatase [Vicinamibacteria bacterium]
MPGKRAIGPPLLALAALGAACGSPPRLQVADRYVDLETPGAAPAGRMEGAVLAAGVAPELRDVAIHGDRRPSIVLKAPSRLVLRAAGAATRLRFGLAVRPPSAALKIRVLVDGAPALEETWRDERGWAERAVDLGSRSGRAKEVAIQLDGDAETVFLGHPQTLAAGDRAAARRPNVVIYVVDCLRADHVGAFGYPLPTTPSLDALAKDSVLLSDLNSCAAWTKPSTACLFTSLLPTYHRARTVDDALARERATLAERFQAAGYRTLAWVANPVIDPALFLFNQGFDRWVDLRSLRERKGGTHVNALEPDAAEITQAVLPWLRAHRDESFFLYLHSLDLHFGYRPRPPFDRQFVTAQSTGLERERQLYDNEVAYNDREIGRLLAALKELALYDDTVVFVTADHGEEFGEHGSTRHGKTLYQELLHIPGILKLPGSAHAGLRLEAVASNIDVAPTLLDIAGAGIPAAFQGRSLLPAIRGGAGPSRPVFAEVVAPQFVGYSARDERYKCIRTLAPTVEEMLFDLSDTPSETRNLAGTPPPQARALALELDRFVMRGQHGYHLALAGPRPGARVRAEATTAAAFDAAFRFGIETGDLMETGPDRRRVVLEFTADGGRRHLVLQTKPEGAPLRLAVRADGVPLAASEIRLGKGDARAGTMPVERERATVSLEDSARLLGAAPAPVRLWYVPLAEGTSRVLLDEETLNGLRALGYVR